MQRRLAAILAADVVGFSRLMEADEPGTLSRLQVNRRDVVLPQVTAHGGRLVKLMGDGSLIEFPSIVSAVACAIEIQTSMAGIEIDIPVDKRIRYRIGINLGDVMVDGDDIYGDGVNVAARLQELAPASGIAISSSVRDHIAGKIPLQLEDRGEQILKNIERPVRVFTIKGEGLATDAVPLDFARPIPDRRRALCVLPFTNMSGDIEQEYFSDGITEDIITDFTKLSSLAVIPRNTAFAFKGKSVRVEQLARDLKVDFVLEGSVRKAGNRVRITAQLIDTANNVHLWADRFDRTLDDVFAIQDEISKNIVQAMKLELMPSDLQAIGMRTTASAEAYEIYLIARSFFYEGQATLRTARRLFERAYTIDSGFARAYAARANCDCYLVFLGESAVDARDILATAKRALELEPGLADAHAALGQAYHTLGRKRDAETEFENALSIDPGLFDAHYLYARHCMTWGEYDKAAMHYEIASDLWPDEYRAPSQAGQAHISLGKRDVAQPWLRESLRRLERAIKARPENADALAYGAVVLVQLNEVERATTWANRAALVNENNLLVWYNLGCFYSLLRMAEQSLDCLEQVASGTAFNMLEWIKHDPDLDFLRDHPRFKAFAERLAVLAEAQRAALTG